MDYCEDYQEIKSILNAVIQPVPKAKGPFALPLQRITETTNNAELNSRGDYLQTVVNTDREMQLLLSSLFEQCCQESHCENCPISKYCNHYINDKTQNYDHDAPVMVDLFCGAGGLSLGFTQEGFITSLANDIEPCCIDTYSHNHPETPRENIVLGDINHVIDHIKELLRFKNVDVIVGGPPCQGFSMANRQRLIDDPRNKLYKSYVKVVSLIKPKFFVMENVKGMLSVASQVIEDFKKIGYDVDCMLFNAKDFGVPQNRERLIYIGNNVGLSSKRILDDLKKASEGAPQYVLSDSIAHLKTLSAMTKKNSTEEGNDECGRKIDRNFDQGMNDYISMINQGKVSPVVFNHKARYNNDRDIEIFGRLDQGDKSDDPKIADIMPYARRNGIFKDKYFKLEEDKVCKTITAHMKFDCNMYIHPTQARGLTPREAARIQSYPDDYFFRGSYTKTYMQIGNSVPPLLGKNIAKVIKKYLCQSKKEDDKS